jgi:hypothetical protein
MKLLMCCGMGRSGSTLQYQIAAEVISRLGLGRGIGFGTGVSVGEFDEEHDWLVCKHENPKPELMDLSDMAISIHRDPRDVVCSFMRWRGMQGKYEDFESAWEETIVAVNWFSAWEPMCKHISRYEDFDIAAEARKIAYHFGLKLGDDADRIAELYSVESNLERMSEMQGHWMNPSTMLTVAHIGESGGASVWRETLTVAQVAIIEGRLGNWMEEHGYSCTLCG